MLKYDLTIYRGDSFQKRFQLRDSEGALQNLTGFSIVSHLRSRATAQGFVSLNASIIVAEEGLWSLSLTPSDSSNIPFASGVYDVEVTYPSGAVKTILFGHVLIKPEVTR